ncbi:glutathione synthase/RimK-type ligase-like ATP-grasp enzyme [Allocatelliglobosispora scoriae]|uniref:Glutathione synthase/RimK-type ligase-like ATP-grasp enzyme n=1 Tax=Allocatelliglobosispora scoriae TaxID=643052 RepID=A0A841BIR1_9ACTN|nr:STM4014 family protein [Allocatelliglobosispora scoriae]MBB5869007.1 glutathione synthase/RimK-type ligase-like ATP-grasp enzyme [Allocatelliglobosispora scoriae]
MSNDTHLTIVGNPDNRRVALFTRAAAAAGLPAPEVIAWRGVAAGEAIAFRPGTLVRIDSPGEDPEVDRLLRHAKDQAEHGEITGTRAWFEGFAQALTRIDKAAADAGAHLLHDPAEILIMFDKSCTHAHLSEAGIPVPPALPDSPGDWPTLRARLRDQGWARVFVKPRHSSSASGVIALQQASNGRIMATTSTELADGRVFNSLRVRTYRDEQTVAAIIDRLAPDGLHVERWFPKADLNGKVVDLRVVVIGGTPTHAVVRSSHTPITNLHLGNTRGDLQTLKQAAGSAYEKAMETCEKTAVLFPGSPHVAIDLMFSPTWQSQAIAEVNAFGDLLPGVTTNGQDTYAAQIATILNSPTNHVPPSSSNQPTVDPPPPGPGQVSGRGSTHDGIKPDRPEWVDPRPETPTATP